jgi:hypothetical protein
MRGLNMLARPKLSLIVLSGMLACGGKETTPTTDANGDDNQVPVADAGTDQTVSADAPVLIDGGSSFDPEGDALTYSWSFGRTPEGSSLTGEAFSINNSSNPSSGFLPDVSGTFIVSLLVTDATGNISEEDTALIIVEAGVLPVANAGIDISTTEGMLVTLDGSGSYDVLNRDLSYDWIFSGVPSSSTLTALSNPTTVEPSFTPDVAGVYMVSLTVNNGVVDSEADIATVSVSYADPEAPIADAGDDIVGIEDCTAIPLNGSNSYDPNGGTLTYLWAVQSTPSDSSASAANFQDPAGQNTTFFPDVAGEYLISLSVYDGDSWSTPDLIMVTAEERETNVPPTVNPGNPSTVDGGNGDCTLSGYTYTCDACEDITVPLGADAVINDVDGDPVEVEWIVISGDAIIEDPSLLSTNITLTNAAPLEPNICEPTDYELQLRAIDCPGDETLDTVVYTVSCCGIEVAQ